MQNLKRKPLWKKKDPKKRKCNLCNTPFTVQTRFDRICHPCKQSNPVYRFYECVPSREAVFLDLFGRFDDKVPA